MLCCSHGDRRRSSWQHSGTVLRPRSRVLLAPGSKADCLLHCFANSGHVHGGDWVLCQLQGRGGCVLQRAATQGVPQYKHDSLASTGALLTMH